MKNINLGKWKLNYEIRIEDEAIFNSKYKFYNSVVNNVPDYMQKINNQRGQKE